MSAFICGQDHFKVLAIFAASRRYGRDWQVDPRYVKGLMHPEAETRGIENLTSAELATLYANTLYQENIRSVLARYPKDTLESAPGPIDKPASIAVTLRDSTLAKYRLKAVAILKMCDCLDYQSCETDDWEETVAFRLLANIRAAAIRTLPGYEDAPWDYCADVLTARALIAKIKGEA